MSEGNSNRKDSNSNNSWTDWLLSIAWEGAKFLAYEAAIFAGAMIISSYIADWAKKSNPNLTEVQAENLQKLLMTAVYDYRNGNPELEGKIVGILALICPDDVDITAVFNSIISDDTEPSDISLTPEQQEQRRLPDEIEFTTMKPEDENSDILIKEFHLDRDLVLKIPISLRACLIETLRTNPTCPISLEPIIDPDSQQISAGITALFQFMNGKPHVYLFDSASIEGWVQQHATNPVTRQNASRKEFFQLS